MFRPGRFDNPLAQFGRLRSRNEHTWGDAEWSAAEGGLPEHVLYGFAVFQSVHDFFQFFVVVCR